jgi:hypothetical protein
MLVLVNFDDLDTSSGMLAIHGLGDLGHKANALTRQGRWNEMARGVPATAPARYRPTSSRTSAG